MSDSRDEALTACRKLVRTFDSAQEPRRQARSVYTALAQAAGWSAGGRRQIEVFGAWLVSLPSVSELKPRCGQLLGNLRGDIARSG
jgi:hypothetical protein